MDRKQNNGLTHGCKSTMMLGKTLIGEPNVGHTETFLSLGCFDTEHETKNCQKCTQTRFFNAMLSTLKVAQHNAKETFKNVPLQNFTDNSDIDWNASLRDIGRTLYREYSLSDEEMFLD